VSRHQGLFTSTSSINVLLLQAGVTQNSFTQIIAQYPHDPLTPALTAHIKESADSVLAKLSNVTPNTRYPLDRLSSGAALIHLYQTTKEARYLAAIHILRESIDLQPKKTWKPIVLHISKPCLSNLDGMYSLAPFLAAYSTSLNTSNEVPFIIDQLSLLWHHTYQPSSNLLVHGFDASLLSSWVHASNSISTGASPFVWGRALGWYYMALIDTLDLLPASSVKTQHWIITHLRTLMHGILKQVYEETGAWFQILNHPERERNYLESSASAIFVYSFLKGVRLSVLHEQGKGNVYTQTALRAYGCIVENFLADDTASNATLGWNGTVGVCSLNSEATWGYYTQQPIEYDSVLGEGAFVVASLEVERLEFERLGRM
jgi:rhamnogalacturonyl hydrolase YesR